MTSPIHPHQSRAHPKEHSLVECSAREPTQIVLPGGHVARCLRLDAEGRLP